MKKTIALLAFASLFAVANAAEDATTWDFSTITNNPAGNGGYVGIQFTLPGEDRMTATPSEEGATLGDLATLNSITIQVGTSGANGVVTGDRVMYLTDASNTLLAVSQVTTLGGAGTQATFSFEETALTLNVGETYYAYFATSDRVSSLSIGDTVASGQYDGVRLRGQGGLSTSTASQLGLMDGQKSPRDEAFAPVVTISVTSATPAVPEPATATLSLLALAGLAARRRRAHRAA